MHVHWVHIWCSKIKQPLRGIDMEKLTIYTIWFLISYGVMWFYLGMNFEKIMNEEKEDE